MLRTICDRTMSQAPDPADKAPQDDNFGGKPSHRQGYAKDKLAWIEYWARKGGCLASGEGAVLCAEIDRLRALVTEPH